MIWLAVVVEGPTEEKFVGQVLAPYLNDFGIKAAPVLVGASSRKFGGGDVHVEILISDICEALEDGYGAVTSLVDLYGFRERRGRTAQELEHAILQGVSEQRVDEPIVRPYVQRHEFECLLFSDPSAFLASRRIRSRTNIERLIGVRNEFETPEDINDDPELKPSKRIKEIIDCYGKVGDGIVIAKKTGVAKIGEECPRFREWLNWMESLGDP